MDLLDKIALTLRTLQVIVMNPALGGGSSVDRKGYVELIGMLAQFVERGEEGREDLVAFAETIQQMADEGRPPNRAEWEDLRSRSQAASDIIQDAAELITERELLETLIQTLGDIPEDQRTPQDVEALDNAKADLEALLTE